MESLILSLIFLSSLQARAQDSKISEYVKLRLQNQGVADIILVLNQQADTSTASKIIVRNERIQYVYDNLRFMALKSQSHLIQKIKSEKLNFRSFYIVNAIAIEGVSEKQVLKLAAEPEVSKIVLDVKSILKTPKGHDFSGFAIKPSEIPENLKQIHADKVWKELGVMGAGIVIAEQDSGFKWDHPALIEQYRGKNSFSVTHDFNWHDSVHSKISSVKTSTSCGYNTTAPCDDHGHGTHTMGTMVGYEWSTKTNIVGVAPEAKWMGCRNMDQGVGKASTYLECFEFFLAPYAMGGDPKLDGKVEFSPHIINNSWACPQAEGCSGHEFEQAIDALQSAGIIVVASAGNEGPGCGSVGDAPGFYSGKIFSVAAYDHRSGSITSFSSRGPSTWNGGVGPNITAPGNGIRSSVPSGGLGAGGLYDYKSGTSMASPHIAGVIALVWSAHPEMIGNIEGTMDLLQRTAQPRRTNESCGKYQGSEIPNAVFGYGIVDAFKAVQLRRQSFF
jgi:serine protease AprX